MIVPVFEEERWLQYLAELPPFEPGDGPFLVISPHPDDETLATGGLIAAQAQRGRDVLVIAVTDGENAYANNRGLGEVRIREQECAIEKLGAGKVRMLRLGLRDSSVAADIDRLVALLRPHVTAGSHIVAPWLRDYHPDHEACGEAAFRIAKETQSRLSWYFFWTWHRGSTDDVHSLDLRTFSLSPEQTERKCQALACHRSQLERDGEPPILPENLLAPARRRFEVFAPAC